MKRIVTAIVIFCSTFVFGQRQNLTKDQVAASGYDLVSYFTDETPQKGSENHTYTLEDAIFYFVSENNKRSFIAAPEKYLPQYGGWCAYAMARGKNVGINPEAYLIEEEKLYLFYKTNWNNTRLKWQENKAVLKSKADENWSKKGTKNK